MSKWELLRHPLIEAGAVFISFAVVGLLVYAPRLQQRIDANQVFLSGLAGTSFYEDFYKYITFQNSSLGNLIQLINMTGLILFVMGVFLLLLFGFLALSQRIRAEPKFEPATEIDRKISQRMRYKRDFFVAFVVLVVGLGLYLYSTNEINSEIEAWPYTFPGAPLSEWYNIQTQGIVILGFGIALFIWYAVKHWINERQLRDMKKSLET